MFLESITSYWCGGSGVCLINQTFSSAYVILKKSQVALKKVQKTSEDAKKAGTSFGKFIDPIADKLLVNTMFVMFAATAVVPVVPVVIMIWRDTIVDGLRMNAAQKGKVVAAGFLGKLKTVTQMLAIIVILLNNLPFELVRFPMSDFLLWFATLISVASGISYFMQLKDLSMESM